MTKEEFWFIVNKQKEYAEIYKKQKEDRRLEINLKCKDYQTTIRRQRGIKIRFPLKY